jgi:hypothetical protein
MLLFIDVAASDERLYQRAVENLRAIYNNVETYEYPADLLRGHLRIKITEKIALMQLVKYCALQNATSWRVGMGSVFQGDHLKTAAHPLPANLLELYRAHRDEITVLADSSVLFLLAYANYMGPCTLKALAHQVGLDEPTVRTMLMPLLRGQFMVHLDDTLQTTGFGRHLLESMGFVGWATPAIQAPAVSLAPESAGVRAWARPVGLALAAVILVCLMMLSWYWSSQTQTQLPLEYTPTYPIVTQTLTHFATPTVTPLR